MARVLVVCTPSTPRETILQSIRNVGCPALGIGYTGTSSIISGLTYFKYVVELMCVAHARHITSLPGGIPIVGTMFKVTAYASDDMGELEGHVILPVDNIGQGNALDAMYQRATSVMHPRLSDAIAVALSTPAAYEAGFTVDVIKNFIIMAANARCVYGTEYEFAMLMYDYLPYPLRCKVRQRLDDTTFVPYITVGRAQFATLSEFDRERMDAVYDAHTRAWRQRYITAAPSLGSSSSSSSSSSAPAPQEETVADAPAISTAAAVASTSSSERQQEQQNAYTHQLAQNSDDVGGDAKDMVRDDQRGERRKVARDDDENDFDYSPDEEARQRAPKRRKPLGRRLDTPASRIVPITSVMTNEDVENVYGDVAVGMAFSAQAAFAQVVGRHAAECMHDFKRRSSGGKLGKTSFTCKAPGCNAHASAARRYVGDTAALVVYAHAPHDAPRGTIWTASTRIAARNSEVFEFTRKWIHVDIDDFTDMAMRKFPPPPIAATADAETLRDEWVRKMASIRAAVRVELITMTTAGLSRPNFTHIGTDATDVADDKLRARYEEASVAVNTWRRMKRRAARHESSAETTTTAATSRVPPPPPLPAGPRLRAPSDISADQAPSQPPPPEEQRRRQSARIAAAPKVDYAPPRERAPRKFKMRARYDDDDEGAAAAALSSLATAMV